MSELVRERERATEKNIVVEKEREERGVVMLLSLARARVCVCVIYARACGLKYSPLAVIAASLVCRMPSVVTTSVKNHS